MDEDPLKFVTAYAATLMQFVNLMAYIASPRLVAKGQQTPSREHLLEHTDQYLALLEHAKQSWREPNPRCTIRCNRAGHRATVENLAYLLALRP